MASIKLFQFDVVDKWGKHDTVSAYGNTEEEARKAFNDPSSLLYTQIAHPYQSLTLISTEEVQEPDYSPWEKGRDMFQPYTASWWSMQ